MYLGTTENTEMWDRIEIYKRINYYTHIAVEIKCENKICLLKITTFLLLHSVLNSNIWQFFQIQAPCSECVVAA